MRQCASSALDFWSEDDYQTAVVHSQYVEHRPTSELSTDGPVLYQSFFYNMFFYFFVLWH